MRVALFGPVYPFRGGIAHYTTRLQRELLAAGHSLLLVSFRRQYPARLFPGQSDRDPSAAPLRPVEPRYWIDSLNPFTWLTTFHRVRQFGPDLLIFPWWTPFFAPLWLSLALLNRLFLGCRLAVLCHNVLPHEESRVDRLLAWAVLGRADRLVVQSGQERQRLLELLPGGDVRVAPHPVYDMWAGARISQAEARQRLGLSPAGRLLLCFGIVRAYKGIDALLEALPAIQSQTGGVHLLIAGEFWEEKGPYEQAIRRLGIEDFVRIDDRYIPDEEAALYFSAADLLVAPYRSVTGSGVIEVAAGFGVAVVTTAAFDATRHHPASRQVAAGDPDALVEGVVGALAELAAGQADAAQPQGGEASGWPALLRALLDREK